MQRDEIEQLLRQSIADELLTRGERAELKDAIAAAHLRGDDLAYLRHIAFKLAATHLQAGPAHTSLMEWLERTVKLLLPKSVAPVGIAEAHFSPGTACRKRICQAFRAARHSVDVCVFTITDNEVSTAIADAHGRGVKVRIITDNDKSEDRGSDVDRLESHGVLVRTDRTEHHMHHKYATFDRRLLITGSYNWTRSAADFNQENIAVTDEPRLVTAFSETFEKLWARFN